MIEIHLLEQLDAVARCGTLSAAAQELSLTQPALSRSMRRLEGELGVTLFDRAKSKVALNASGHLAAELARAVLRDDAELVRQVRVFDRNLRSVALGSCAPWPIIGLARLMQRYFSDMTISSRVVKEDAALVEGLRSRTYQLVALHELPEARDIFCQRFATESMGVSFKLDHPLAGHAQVSFDDLAGESILAWGNVSFWNDLVRRRCPRTNVLFQADMDSLEELVMKTDFPVFTSDRMAEAGYAEADRVDVPIADDEATATYYIACLDAEKSRYSAFFNGLRAQALAHGA